MFYFICKLKVFTLRKFFECTLFRYNIILKKLPIFTVQQYTVEYHLTKFFLLSCSIFCLINDFYANFGIL